MPRPPGARLWSPDGRIIAFGSNHTDNPDAYDNSDVFTSDIESNPSTPSSRRSGQAHHEHPSDQGELCGRLSPIYDVKKVKRPRS